MYFRGVIVFCGVLALVGCGKHDLPYYQENLDQAKIKDQDCRNELSQAQKKRDEDAVLSILNNDECNAAYKALSQDRQKQRIQYIEDHPIVIDETPLMP